MAYSVWIEAGPDQVWRTYVDPARIPDWQTGRPVIADVRGLPGEPGSGYVSRRGPLAGRTTVLTSNAPHEVVTSTEAFLGLRFEVRSRLVARAGGTDLQLLVTTRWRRRVWPLTRLVELVILNDREARKELGMLKSLVEGESPT